MKNTYFIGYFPFIVIVLFSISFAIYSEGQVLDLLVGFGLYKGMLEIFSEMGIKLALLIVLTLLFFMILAALKLISDTIIEVSLLFFSKDSEGTELKNIRIGAVIYVIGAVLSLFSVQSLIGLLAIFIVTNLVAFTFFVYKVSATLSTSGLVGIIFFHFFTWCLLILVIAYVILKLYNSLINSLPI